MCIDNSLEKKIIMKLGYIYLLVPLLGIFIQDKMVLATDSPYFDVTESLNRKNDTEIQNALNLTKTMYYSTDLLITEILDLSWIPNLIINNFPPSEDVGFCLMLSFQITKDKHDINWKYIQDIFYNLPDLNSTENQERQQLLRKHVCKIVLNFEADYKNSAYQLSESYCSEASISFTKYAKKLLLDIFGPEKVIPVGVLYTEAQILNDKFLLEQEIQYADFVIISLKFTPMSKMPFLFPQFEEYFENVLTKNTEYLANFTKDGKNIPQTSIVVWEKFVIAQTYNNEWERHGDQNIISSQPMYLELFHDFVTSGVRNRKGNIEVISQTIFDLQEREINLDEDHLNLRHIIPYLYVQESDINPCMMIRTLLQISQFGMESLAVNEFTWNAIVRYKPKLIDQEYSKETCGCSLDVEKRVPRNILLVVSKLTSMHWDQTGTPFKKLISDNTNAADMNLTTVIIPVNDSGKSLHSDIKNFFNSWLKANNTRLGCQVDVSQQAFMEMSEGIIGHTERRCQPILHISKVVVWQIDVSSKYVSAYNFSYDFDSGSLYFERILKKGLFRMLAERDIYKRRRPDKEVMFSVLTKELVGEGTCPECDHNAKMKEMEFRQSVAIWAKIHKVRIIFQPAFDFKNNLNSLFEFPRQNENGSFDRCSFTF